MMVFRSSAVYYLSFEPGEAISEDACEPDLLAIHAALRSSLVGTKPRSRKGLAWERCAQSFSITSISTGVPGFRRPASLASGFGAWRTLAKLSAGFALHESTTTYWSGIAGAPTAIAC